MLKRKGFGAFGFLVNAGLSLNLVPFIVVFLLTRGFVLPVTESLTEPASLPCVLLSCCSETCTDWSLAPTPGPGSNLVAVKGAISVIDPEDVASKKRKKSRFKVQEGANRKLWEAGPAWNLQQNTGL